MEDIPLYVTRKTANGRTGSISVSPALFLMLIVLGVLNAVGWMAYGLVALVLAFAHLF